MSEDYSIIRTTMLYINYYFKLLQETEVRKMNTSQKHRRFVAEPMGSRPVEDLPGIGPVLGARLRDQGFGEVGILVAVLLSTPAHTRTYTSFTYHSHISFEYFVDMGFHVLNKLK